MPNRIVRRANRSRILGYSSSPLSRCTTINPCCLGNTKVCNPPKRKVIQHKSKP